MRRAGGWVLGLVVVAAMAGGSWVAFRPILNRQTLRIGYVVAPEARIPSSDAMMSGARFALEETGFKTKGYQLQFYAPLLPSDPPVDILIALDDRHLLHAEFPDKPRGAGDPPADNRNTVFLRPLANLEDQGNAAALWASNAGYRKPVVLVDKDNRASDAICFGFVHQATYEPLRLEPIDTATDRERLLDRVLSAKPDLVFYAGEAAPYSTAYDLFSALRKRGYAGPLMMGDADPEVSPLAVPHRVVEGTVLVSPITPPSKEFAAAYEPATRRLAGPHAWPAYCTMKAVLEVLENAGPGGMHSFQSAVGTRKWDVRPCAVYVSRGGKFEVVRDLK